MVKFISTDGNISSIFIRCILLISAYFIAPCQQNMILIYTWRATISRSGPLDLILEANILHGGVSMCDYHIPIIWNTEVAFMDDVSSVLSLCSLLHMINGACISLQISLAKAVGSPLCHFDWSPIVCRCSHVIMSICIN